MGIASSFKEFPCEYKVAAAVVAVTVVVLAGIGGAYALSSSITVESNAMLSEGIAIDVYEGGSPNMTSFAIPAISVDGDTLKPDPRSITIGSDKTYTFRVYGSSEGDSYVRVYAVMEGDASLGWIGIDSMSISVPSAGGTPYVFGKSADGLQSGVVSDLITVSSNTSYSFTITINLKDSTGLKNLDEAEKAYDLSGLRFIFKAGSDDPLLQSP